MTTKQAETMKRFLPLGILVLLMVAAWTAGLGDLFSFDALREQRTALKTFVGQHPTAAPAVYMTVYIVATALSVPGAVFLTLAGGFLFPQPWATLYVVTSATIGAILIFLAAKTALGDWLKSRTGGAIRKMEEGFQEGAANYLLFLRLVPIFPFWLVNLAPAFFGVPLTTFAWTTFFGILPGSFVYTQAGAGLGAIFDSGETFSIHNVLNRDVKIALVALGLFALLPAVVKKLRKKSDKEPS